MRPTKRLPIDIQEKLLSQGIATDAIFRLRYTEDRVYLRRITNLFCEWIKIRAGETWDSLVTDVRIDVSDFSGVGVAGLVQPKLRPVNDHEGTVEFWITESWPVVSVVYFEQHPRYVQQLLTKHARELPVPEILIKAHDIRGNPDG